MGGMSMGGALQAAQRAPATSGQPAMPRLGELEAIMGSLDVQGAPEGQKLAGTPPLLQPQLLARYDALFA